jgi:hypothetical protein
VTVHDDAELRARIRAADNAAQEGLRAAYPAEELDPCECPPCVARRRRKANRLPAENGDYAAALTRQIAAYGRRVGDGDPEDLTTALGVLGALEEAIAGAVAGLRAQGWSWAAVGRAAGITRQGAEQRWGDS